MSAPKLVPTDAAVAAHLDAVERPEQRADAEVLVALLRRLTGEEPKMWGPSIIGFGQYHYKYASGHEGDAPLAAFAPRKGNTVVYVTPGLLADNPDLQRLGKHKASKGGLYIKRLADVDLAVLEGLVRRCTEIARQTYG